eukprot:10325031-Alexandrium_andersonii.AAC.1
MSWARDLMEKARAGRHGKPAAHELPLPRSRDGGRPGPVGRVSPQPLPPAPWAGSEGAEARRP